MTSLAGFGWMSSSRTSGTCAARDRTSVEGIVCKAAQRIFASAGYTRHRFSTERLACFAGNPVRPDAQLWRVGAEAGKASDHSRRRRRQWKKPDLNCRSLPSRHRLFRKVDGICERSRCKSTFAGVGERRQKAVPTHNFAMNYLTSLARFFATFPEERR